MVFSFGNLVIFGGKPENWEIRKSFRENPDYFGRVNMKAMIASLSESLNNKLEEHEANFILRKIILR